MLDLEIIKKLNAAGVDPAVLLNIILEDDGKKAEEQPAPEQPKPEAAPAPAPEPEKPAPAADTGDKILAAIERLTGAVQASNIMNFSAGDPKGESVDDILAEMLTPKKGA